MSEEKLPIAIYGSDNTHIDVGNGITIGAYVLDNGLRVLSQSEMLKALGISYGTGKKGTDRLASFAAGNRIKEFISNEIVALIEKPIKFKIPTGGNIAYGYEATVLQQVVRGVAKAHLQGKLQKQQEHIGRNAEILDDAFSKVGLIALIDEATGYQKDVNRAKDELQQLLSKFLLKEHAKWLKTFPDEFFEMIFKMKGWTWVGISKTKRPQVLGHYINDLVYARLAPTILDELRDRNPVLPSGMRKTKHHQWLTPDMGHPALKDHLTGILALGRASGYSWTVFMRMMNRSYPKFGTTMELLFPDQELLEDKKPTKELSTFDRMLKGVLAAPPPPKEEKRKKGEKD